MIRSVLFLLTVSIATLPAFAQDISSSNYSNENDYEFFVQQAQAYDAAGIYDSALVAYEKAYEAEPDREEIYNPLTKKYVFLGLFDEATTRLRELYINHPEEAEHDHEYMVWSGTCLMGFYEALRGDYETALNFTEISVASSDIFGRYHCAMRVMTAAEKYDKAAFYIDTLNTVRNTPSHMVQYGTWGHYVESRRGNAAKAKEYLSNLIQLRQAFEQGAFREEDGPQTRYYLALIYLAEGNEDKAIEQLRNAYEMGNRQYYWWTNINPMLDELEGIPAYDELMKEMKADIDRMRQRYLGIAKEDG